MSSSNLHLLAQRSSGLLITKSDERFSAIVFKLYFDETICPPGPPCPTFNARFSVFEESSLTSYIVCKADSSNTSPNPTSFFLVQVDPNTGAVSSSIKTTKPTWYYCMDVVALSSKKAAILTMARDGRFSIFIMDFTLGSSTETQSTQQYTKILLGDLDTKPAGQFYKLDSASSTAYTEVVITGFSKGLATSSGGSD